MALMPVLLGHIGVNLPEQLSFFALLTLECLYSEGCGLYSLEVFKPLKSVIDILELA